MRLEITEKELERLQDTKLEHITKLCNSGVKLRDLVDRFGEDACLELYVYDNIEDVEITVRFNVFETDEQYRNRIQRLQGIIEKNKIKRKMQITEEIEKLKQELENL